MTPAADSPNPSLADGRQSEAALAIQRGARRVLAAHGFASATEIELPDGRRADIVAIGPAGEIWIVEIKSSVADFRADRKWEDYRAFSDRLLFAVAPEFPAELIPDQAGLLIADRYGGEIHRTGPLSALAPARRKSLTLRLVRKLGARLQAIADPEARLDGDLDPR